MNITHKACFTVAYIYSSRHSLVDHHHHHHHLLVVVFFYFYEELIT
jgi:hypothetical protein